MNYFFISIIVIAEALGISIPQAFEQALYVAPTTSTESEPLQQYAVLPISIREAEPPIKKNNDAGPTVTARSALLMDADSQRILWQKNPDLHTPIASITKLMTALVWFDHQPKNGLEHLHTIAPEEDTPEGKELNLPHGEQLRAFDLLRSSLVGSDNDTALALAHSTELSDDEFVEFMNQKARALSMRNTEFADATGLSSGNTSTAHDVALLALAAFKNSHIQQPSSMREHIQKTANGSIMSRVRTTNKLLYDQDLTIIGGKTGFTTEAGYCVVVQARELESGRDVIAVILSAGSEQNRFDEAKQLLQWAFAQYEWPAQ